MWPCLNGLPFLVYRLLLLLPNKPAIANVSTTVPTCVSSLHCWVLTEDTCCVGVALEGRRTDAGGPVVVHPADGLCATLLGDAGVPALLPDACKVQGALWIRCTFRRLCYKQNASSDYTQQAIRLTYSNGGADLVSIALISGRADASRPVVLDFTECIDPALVVINAGIFTLLTDTSQSSWAVLVNSTLRLALDKGVSLQSRRTGALADAAGRTSNSVLTARIGVAGIESVRLWWWRPPTLNQGIANVAREAGADGRVIPDVTLGIATADPGTGVVALVVTARLVQGTVAVDNTLWLALNVRIPEVERGTGALASLRANLPGGQGAAATGVRLAWIVYDRLG